MGFLYVIPSLAVSLIVAVSLFVFSSWFPVQVLYYHFYFYYSFIFYFFFVWDFFILALADAFPWSLNDSKSSKVSRTLLSILADPNNAVVWMVFTCFSYFQVHPLSVPILWWPVPSAPITIGITVTFMFDSFFSSLARSRYLSLFSLSFSFTLWSAGMAKSTIRQVLVFFIFFVSYH